MFEYKEIYKYPTNVCLNVTDDCILGCKYCFVQQKPHYMSLQTAKDAMDYIHNNLMKKREILNKPKEKAMVTYFGGEPTMLWNQIIVPLTLYAEEKYPDEIQFTITTNGVLLSEERIKWMNQHNFSPLLSIDGIKEVQDYNRPMRNGESSFDAVIKNVPYLLYYFPQTTFRATVYQDTCDKMLETYLMAEQLGFQNIFFCPNAREKWTEENKSRAKKSLQELILYMGLRLLDNKPLTLHCNSINIHVRKLMQKIAVEMKELNLNRNINRNIFRCGLGTSMASINYEGDIFGCQEQDSRDTSEPFFLGSIYTGINVAKHTELLKEYNSQGEFECEVKDLCAQCKLKDICFEDICPSVSKDRFNSFKVKPEIDCLFSQWIAEIAQEMINVILSIGKTKTFDEYMNEIFEKDVR